VLKSAYTISDKRKRAEVLSMVAGELPSEEQRTVVLGNALAIAHTINADKERIEVLSIVASNLPQKEQLETLGEALGIARDINDKEEDRTRALRVVIARMPSEATGLLDEALAISRATDGEYYRAEAIRAVVMRLPQEATELLRKALSVVRAISDKDGRACALSAIAMKLSPEEQHMVLSEAVADACAVENPWYRSHALIAVAESLPPEATKKLNEVLIAGRAIEEWPRVEIMSAVAEKLPPGEQRVVLREALAFAMIHYKSMKYVSRIDALCAVIAKLPPAATELFDEVLAAVHTIDNKYGRVEALCTLATRMPLAEQQVVLNEALSIARAIDGKDDRVRVLHDVVVRISPKATELLREALAAIRAIDDDWQHIDALSAVAIQLPPAEQLVKLGEVLTMARAISNEAERTKTLTAIAARVPPEAAELLGEILAAACVISDERDRTSILSAVAARVPPEATELLGKTLTAACAINDEGARATLLNEVVARVPPIATELLSKALTIACAIGNEWQRARVLSTVAAQLPPEAMGFLTALLVATRTMGENDNRAFVLSAVVSSAVVSKLPIEAMIELLRETLAAAHAIGDERTEWGRMKALGAVVTRVPPEAVELLSEALMVARAFKWRYEALSLVATKLPLDEHCMIMGEALAAAGAMDAGSLDKDYFHASTLIYIAERLLPEAVELLDEILTAVHVIKDERQRVWAMSSVAMRLPSIAQCAELDRALSVARAIDDDAQRAETLCIVAQKLPLKKQRVVLREALAAACAIDDESRRASALSDMVKKFPQMPIDLQTELLNLALQMVNWSCSTEILAYITPNWPEICHIRQHTEVEELALTLRAFATASRERLLDAIKVLIPVIAQMGTKGAMAEIAQAILDVKRWWP
jgi:hypothetical protein